MADLLQTIQEQMKGLQEQITQLVDIVRRHQHRGIESIKLNNGITVVPMSFETGEQTATKIYFPFAVSIKKIRGFVQKAIAATNDGTITGANSTGDTTGGLITATASDAINTEYSVTPTVNYLVGKDDYYKLTSAKATAGGKVLVTLEWERA